MKARLGNNPDATMADAHRILSVARTEATGQKQGLHARQAAEKVWLAASTVGDAMAGPVNNASQVFRAFERAWGTKGREVAEDIETSLHRGCFYGNAPACDGDFVLRHVRALGSIMRKPIRDRQIRARIAR